MATSAIFRIGSKGGSHLLRPHILCRKFPGVLAAAEVPRKTFGVTPTSSAEENLPIFRARRGPFTYVEKHGKHMLFTSTHWKIERVLAISMLGILPASVINGGTMWDMLLTTTVFMHGFWSLDHVLTDYLQKFVPFIHYVWYVLSALCFAGLMSFNYNDVGVTKAISMIWKL